VQREVQCACWEQRSTPLLIASVMGQRAPVKCNCIAICVALYSSVRRVVQRIHLSGICVSSWYPQTVILGQKRRDRRHWDLPQAALPVLFLLTADFWVFRPAGATCCTDQGEIWHRGGPLLRAKFHLDRSRGGGLRPQNWKKWNFTNIIAPKGRVPCTIFFTKFTFVRVVSLHNFAKFGCFISINDKIISNLLRWGVFSQFFDDP